MKLYFEPNETLWQPERYHYAAEQMMLTLFPGEKPEYPDAAPNMMEEHKAAAFSLSVGEESTVTAQVTHGGKTAEGSFAFPAEGLNAAPEQVYHVLQHAIKMAFYAAGKDILGIQPPWGALTGVRPVKLPTRAMMQGNTPAQAREELERHYDVTPVRAQLALDCAKASIAVDESLRPDEVSIYVGIPFCPTRCSYCSFVSSDVHKALKLISPYLEQVFEEIDATAAALKEAGLKVRSFYMGGGPPTTLTAEQMDALLTRCEQSLPLENCTEFTVEAGRPDTITREKQEVLKRHNIGRISINPQTLQDDVLRSIGRRHNADDIRKAYALAREVGFECINMDLIAGLPRDTYEGFCASLEGVLEMDPENVTVHTLALKKGSTLMEKGASPTPSVPAGHLPLTGGVVPSGEDVARMLEFTLNTLRNKGYLPYYLYRQKYMSGSLENVGWSKPGTESLYNIVMMEELHTVVAIGGGGVTKLVDAENARIIRLPNPKYPHDYLTMTEKIMEQKKEIVEFYK